MSIQRTLLLIADIGGYTRFMKAHRWNLAHAQDTVAQLLEAVIDSAAPFTLSKLEGDAAFFYVPQSARGLDLYKVVASIRNAFVERRRRMTLDRMCTCEGCTQIDALKIKFVAHAGDVAFQKVKGHTELAGMDVILLHRMLKNDVPVPEYVLTTDEGLVQLDDEARGQTRVLDHDFEGIGPTRTHYYDLANIALPPITAAPSSTVGKVWQKLKQELRIMPYVLGLKSACEGFKTLGEHSSAPSAPTAASDTGISSPG